MINVRGLVTLAIIALVSLAACQSRAAESPAYSCADIRAAVKTIQTATSVSRQKAIDILESTAKGNGATKEQIETARRCIGEGSK